MSDRDGRPETNASDYFSNQKKALAINDRRPLIRKASDLVGPGISANAVRVTNFNDLLATYNGFFSADVGAANAPPVDQAYVGFTTSDAGLGGAQQFYGLSDNIEYYRTFIRSPLDPSALFWTDWTFEQQDTDWTLIGAVGAPAFQNDWTNYGSTWVTARVMREAHHVNVQGFVKNGDVGAAIFTLDEGFRPGSDLHFPSVALTQPGFINVFRTGDVVAHFSDPVPWVTLSNIAFPAEG